MDHCNEKLSRIKSMHTSNFIFWVLGKFLIGLGLGILLATYFWTSIGYWVVAGWLLIVFAVILMIPAMMAACGKKGKAPPKPKMK